MAQKRPVFKTSLAAMVMCIVICGWQVLKGSKPKQDFLRVDGIIEEIANINDNYPGKDTAKYRYIEIDNYPKPFQLFIGKATGDFAPQYDATTLLTEGDSLTVYFDETSKTKIAPVNNLVYFMDRGSRAVFIQGNSKKNLFYGVIGFCLLFSGVLYLLKHKGKIE